MDAVTAFFLAIDEVESERGFGYTVDLSDKVPAFIVKEGLAVCYKELKITDLRCIDRRVIHFGHTTVVQRVPDAAEVEYAVPTASLVPRVHLGSMPGPPGAKRRSFMNVIFLVIPECNGHQTNMSSSSREIASARISQFLE